MQINIHNYEQYLVDYAEGTLSTAMHVEVEAFLLAHPEIQEELDMFLAMDVNETEEVFADKSCLKQIPMQQTETDSEAFSKLCIGHIENINSHSEEQFLENLIKNDESKKTVLARYKKTKLKAENITFNEKLLTKKEVQNHTIDAENFTEYCIACSEGWLDYKGQIALNDFISHRKKRQDQYNFIASLKLKPDESIVYEGKSKLKRFRLITIRNKKRIAYASAIASMLLFSVMVYNSNQLDNSKQLSSAIQPVKVEAIEVQAKEKTNVVQSVKEEQKVPLYKDPLQITKIKFEEPVLKTKNNLDESMASMNPIRLLKIDCPKCIAYNETSSFFKYEVQNTSMNKHSLENIEDQTKSDDDIAWKIAQAGIYGINKLTSTEMQLRKESNNENTRIAFNSKLFSFSAPVKKKRTL